MKIFPVDDKILFGGDYNPEQWKDRPDVIEEDISIFHKLGINIVTLDVFSWAILEPSEGVYDFSFATSILDRMKAEGIHVILATPSGARPVWLAKKYPEVLRVTEDRRRMLFGERHNHCYTSPVFRRKVIDIDERLSCCFGHHDAVVGWHISNEYGGECHCDLCQDAFRKWLSNRYGDDIDLLNRKWNNAFWSHIYGRFDEIDSPSSIGESKNPSLNLDWKRFVTCQTVDFMNMEIEAVRKYSDLPVTTNMMYDYDGLDYSRFAESLDFISWDDYPVWGVGYGGDDVLVAVDNAIEHDYFRSLKKDRPFILMESCPSSTNWQSLSFLKRPGVLEAASLEAVAHGSDSVMFFQLRRSRGGYEKFHGAVIDCNGPDARVQNELLSLSEKLRDLKDVCGSMTYSDIAIVKDSESRWAMEGSAGPRNAGLHYRDLLNRLYLGVKTCAVNIDVIESNHDFDCYRMLVVPMLYMFKNDVHVRLRRFVENGGTIVVTYWSCVADENDSILFDASPFFFDLLGLRRLEVDSLPDGKCNSAIPVAGNFAGIHHSYECSTLAEIIETTSALSLMTYDSDFYKGKPVVTFNRFGKGSAIYIASLLEERFYIDFFSWLLPECGIRQIVKGLPRGVFASSRKNEKGEYIFIQNFSIHEVSLAGIGSYGYHPVSGGFSDILPSYGTAVYKKPISGGFAE